MSRSMWTESDREVLRRTYADCPTENIARSIGRTVGQVYQQAQALGSRSSQSSTLPDGLSCPSRSSVRCLRCDWTAT